MLRQVLEQIGLTEKEAKIYLALLEMGAQGATIISNKTQINRTTCYLILENLKEKGLISTHTEGNIQFFEAQEPSSLLTYLNKQQNDLVAQQNMLQNNMPYLEAIKKSITGSTTTKYFKGPEGIINLYKETLTTDEKTIYSFLDITKIPQDFLNNIDKFYVIERVEKQINAKIINISKDDVGKGSKSLYSDTESLREFKNIFTNQEITVEIQTIGDKTLITNFSPDNLFGVLIQNKELATTIKTLHKIMWDLN